jgi:hypothetical protein
MSTWREDLYSDLSAIAQRILDGTLEIKRGCYLEVSRAAWKQASQLDRDRFEHACHEREVAFEHVSQTGGVHLVCPEEKVGGKR